MSAPKVPLGDGDVPDKALEELLAAFAGSAADSELEVDFDDPSIDAMLGLTPGGDADESGEAVEKSEVEAGAAPPTVEQDAMAPAPPVTAIANGSAQPAAAAPVRQPIQIGGDDELPDAVYLDEEGEERLRGTSARSTEASVREERGTILIGDDEIEGSAGGIPTARGSSMDPRFRARRIAVKRAAGLRRLKWFVLAAAIILIVTAGLVLLGSSLFAVDEVTISGHVRADQADVDEVVEELEGTPVLLVDTGELEAKLERSPWVREARVTTDFPHGATIELLERVPLATYQGSDGRFRIIDVEGKVVDVLKGQPIEFMQITGAGINAERGDFAGVAFTHAAELIESLSPAVRSRTAAVEVGDTGELSLRFHPTAGTGSGGAGQGALVVLGSPTELLEKLTRLEALIKNKDLAGCTRIDVSTAEVGADCLA